MMVIKIKQRRTMSMAEKIRNNALRIGAIGEWLIELILIFKLIKVGKFWSYVASLIMMGDVSRNAEEIGRLALDMGSELISCESKDINATKKPEKIQMGFVVEK